MGVNGPKTGHKMKLYRNTGTVAVPVWTLVTDIGDVSIPDFTRGLAELKRRGNEYTKNLPSLFQSISLEFRLHHGLSMTVFEAMMTEYLAGTPKEWAIMDDLITVEDAQGLRCPFLIEQFPWDQSLEEVSGHDIRLAIAYMEEGGVEVDPSWYTVPGV